MSERNGCRIWENKMKPSDAPVLLDSSVWIDSFRDITPQVVELVRRFLHDDRVVTCGPVLFEIKRGLRPRERKKILRLMSALPRLPVNENDWDAAAELDAKLRRKGVTIPLTDCLIAELCLRHKLPLFSLDAHFRSVPGLKLLEP